MGAAIVGICDGAMTVSDAMCRDWSLEMLLCETRRLKLEG